MRFLIVRMVAIGDVALTTPVVARIKAQYPDAHITWLCGRAVNSLVRLVAGVDDTIVVDENALLRGGLLSRVGEILRVWSILIRRSFDVVLMAHPDPRYRVLTLPLLGARVRAASHGPGRNTNPVRGRYRGDEAARLLDGAAWSGPEMRRYPLADLRPALSVMKRDNRRSRVVLVPGGARNVLREDARRRWPVTSYRLLAEQLTRDGHAVVLIGDSHDRVLAEHFIGAGVTSLMGELDLIQTLSELRQADLVITHDTGPLHLARLVRAPTIALFGPTDPAEFVSPDDEVTVLRYGGSLPCRPCYDGRDYPPCTDHVCMSGITVAEVMAAINTRLNPAAARLVAHPLRPL